MKTYKVECLTDVPGKTGLTVRIRRGDEQVYDATSKKFQTQKYFDTNTAANPLIPLTPGTGLDSYLVNAVVNLDPSQFTDGDYNLYFYDETNKLFTGYRISIFNGDAKAPNPTDIAVRILDGQAGNGKVRDAFIKINKSS